MAHGDGALYRAARQAFAGDHKVHIDSGEHFGVDFGALCTELDRAAAHVLPAAFEDQHHVIGGAAAGAGQHGFHGARGQVGAAVVGFGGVWGAVHHQGVAAAGLRYKRHGRTLTRCGGRACPADYAFHE